MAHFQPFPPESFANAGGQRRVRAGVAEEDLHDWFPAVLPEDGRVRCSAGLSAPPAARPSQASWNRSAASLSPLRRPSSRRAKPSAMSRAWAASSPRARGRGIGGSTARSPSPSIRARRRSASDHRRWTARSLEGMHVVRAGADEDGERPAVDDDVDDEAAVAAARPADAAPGRRRPVVEAAVPAVAEKAPNVARADVGGTGVAGFGHRSPPAAGDGPRASAGATSNWPSRRRSIRPSASTA